MSGWQYKRVPSPTTLLFLGFFHIDIVDINDRYKGVNKCLQIRWDDETYPIFDPLEQRQTIDVGTVSNLPYQSGQGRR